MDLNATILCEFLIFGLFYKIVQKHVWPAFQAILKEREEMIAAGLESAAKGHKMLDEAQQEAAVIVKNAMKKAEEIMVHAEQEAAERKNKLSYELELLKEKAQSQAEEEYKQLQHKFYQEAKNHYLEIASKLCKVALQETSTQQLIDRAVLERALSQLELS